MDQRLQEVLFESFPRLYIETSLGMDKSCMAWGITCRDGWFLILWDLSKDLEQMGVVAAQVKEKFGTLSFYIHGGLGLAADRIHKAEKLSGKTCENCGQPGITRGGSWIQTLCDPCHESKK